MYSSTALSSSRRKNSSSSSSKKRALVEADEPPSRKARRDVLSAELATLQADLEHEQSLRQLDARRHQTESTRLQRKLEMALEEAKEARTLLEEVQQESEHHIAQQREARRNAQFELRDVQQQLEEARALAAQEVLEEDPHIQTLHEQLDAKADENEHLQQLCQDLKQQLQAFKTSQQENKTPTKEQTPLGAISKSPPAVMKELNRVRIQLAETERKNRQLKRLVEDLQKKASLLVKEKETSKSATSRLVQVEQQIVQLNKQKSQESAVLESWKAFGKFLYAQLGENEEEKPPEQGRVQRFLLENSKKAASLQAENSNLEKSFNSVEEKMQSLQKNSNELVREKLSLEKQLQDQKDSLSVKEKSLQLKTAQESVWKREIESLRQIVKTFDELPLGTSSTKTTNESSFHQVSLQSAQEEISLLKQAQESVQKDLDAALEEKEEAQTTHSKVLEKFGKLKDALYEERAKAQKAEQRACRAEELAGKGSFNAETTRVLHLSKNPVTAALREEVTVLKRQLQVLQKDEATVAAAVGSDVDPNKLHQRLKESFKEQIGKFREGVYLITGLKIDMIPSQPCTKFKVRSVFAEQEHDHLMLQWPCEQDSMDLLNTDLAQSLTTTPSYEYISRCHSLPAFVASVQLNLFEKQTMM